jgi:hypothetical protein
LFPHPALNGSGDHDQDREAPYTWARPVDSRGPGSVYKAHVVHLWNPACQPTAADLERLIS